MKVPVGSEIPFGDSRQKGVIVWDRLGKSEF